MKTLSKLKIYVLALIIAISAVGCNSWLDLLPENSQSSDQYWNTKDDVEAVVMSGYVNLRTCHEQFIQWGELRGDALIPSTGVSNNEMDIWMLQILSDNSICKWDKFYKVIGDANAVIKYAPEVYEKDETFALELMNSFIGEAKFQRALAYFYLIRTFGEVPLVLEPFVDDNIEFVTPKVSEDTVLMQIKEDIKDAVLKCKPGYGIVAQNKGRATRWAAYALQAEVCLWTEDYEGAISACQQIIASGQYSLMSRDKYYEIYYPGLSDESVLELQWVYNNMVASNNLISYFYTNPHLVISNTALNLFTQYSEDDYRGLGASYTSDRKIWKYAGTEVSLDGVRNRGTQEYPNWILYRYADVLLMQAEAYAMTEKYSECYQILLTIRERAGLTFHPGEPVEKRQALELVLDEREKELLAEGKRWFDILRTAKRHDYEYKDYLLEVVLANVSAQYRPVYEAKLQDPRGYYLPIHKDEITANGGVLVQNPYYEDLD